MKKHLILTFSLAGILLLAGCSSGDGDNAPDTPDYVYEEFAKASASFKMRAKETETVSKLSGETMVQSEYQYDVTNVRGDHPAVKKTISQVTSSGFTSSTYSYIKGSRGFVAEEGLDYKNEVFEIEALDSDGSKVVYDREFANPFSFLTKGDVAIKDSEPNCFSLNNNGKLQLFSRYLLAPSYEVASVDFLFEGENLKKIHLESKLYEITYQDAYTSNYILANLKYTVDCNISDIGNATYTHLEPEKSKDKEKESILKNAFKNMGENFTMSINTHYKDEAPNTEYDTYWYFNGGDAVYHQQTLSDRSRRFDLYYKKDTSKSEDLLYLYDFDETTGTWKYYEPIASSSYNITPQDYSFFLPKFADTAPELFEYDEENDKFVCSNERALAYLGNAFLGGGYKASYFTLGMGDQAEIYLNSDKTKISKIVVGYNEVDSEGYDISRSFTLTFSNVGTTIIPSFVEA